MIEMTKKDFFGKFKSLFLWGNLIAVLLVLMLLFFGLKWWLSYYTHHGENIEVPDLSGKSLEEADELLSGNGLQLRLVGESYNKNVPDGHVLTQNPKAGANVKEGRIIYITVNSLKVPKVRIPDVIGYKSYRGTQADLLDLDFELTDPIITRGPRDLVMKILCDGREVRNGEEVAKYSRLTIVIGDGWGDVNGEPDMLHESMPEETIMEELDDNAVEDHGNGDTFEVFE